MKKTFKFIIDSRKAFIQLIDSLSNEQLNQIPEGFNNNIIWNFGHIIVSTQALCYVRTEVRQDTSFIKYATAYGKGSKPTYIVTDLEVQDLKALALQTIKQLEADYDSNLFSTITPFETSTYFAAMDNIEEVIAMTSGHDNLHYGYAIAQKRIINK